MRAVDPAICAQCSTSSVRSLQIQARHSLHGGDDILGVMSRRWSRDTEVVRARQLRAEGARGGMKTALEHASRGVDSNIVPAK
jgi:hypothetical protein